MISPDDILMSLAEVGERIGRKPATIRSWLKPGNEKYRANDLVLRHAGGYLYSTRARVAAWMDEIDRATKNGEIVWRKAAVPVRDTRTLPLFDDEEFPVVG